VPSSFTPLAICPDPESCCLQGKVALILHGGCAYNSGSGYAVKARYAQRAGAIAVVIINDSKFYTTSMWRPEYYSPANWAWVDEIIIPVVNIRAVDGWALRAWLANGLDLIASPIDSRTLGVRVAGTCGTVDIGGTPCLAHQVKHVDGEATCYTDCHESTLRPGKNTYQGSANTTISGVTCKSPCRDVVEGWYMARQGPWCWTNQEANQRESCGIPACTLMGTLHANVGSCNSILGVNAFELTSGFDGEEWTWSECAEQCLTEHSDAVAIDGPKHGTCYCHTSCPDLLDCGEDDSMALNGFELPTSCGSDSGP